MIRAIVLVALVVRLAVVLATPHFVPRTDAAEYDHNAVSLVQHGKFAPSVATFHGGPTAYHPPAFSVLLAGAYKLVGTGSAKTRWEAGRILNAILGAAAVALICLIALRLWGRRVALLAGGIAAVSPPLVLVGSTLMSEPLFIVLELAAVLAALAHRESPHRWRWAVATGVLAALGALTRGNGLLLLVPLFFLVWCERPRRSWRSLRAPAAMVAAAALTLVPWTIRNLSAFHQFVPVTTETGYALAGTYNGVSQSYGRFPAMWQAPFYGVARILRSDPHANEAQISSRLTTQAIDYVDAHPAAVPKTAYWNILRLLNFAGPGFEHWIAYYESYPPWLAVASAYAFWLMLALALAGAGGRAVRCAPLAIWGVPLVIFLLAVGLMGSTRYRSPADPFVILLAALGLVAAYEGLSARRPVRSAGVPA